ncbi:SPOR domain-containing protein [Pelagibius sp.]|uniref:SPOR domain-containing protein n=1 Tax=Pelagibius sp. TaxID=1931238 RepID=UPI0026139066|nr:SPOR domain-containing protein [Pelagibius sp.]
MAMTACVVAAAVLSACTVEVGPPPESDPPLVAEREKQPPPPPQPTEPQAWSRDINFEGGEQRVQRDQMAEGLVGEAEAPNYSGERLTYESALSGERPPTPAELMRERARQRLLEAQGGANGTAAVPPPQIAAAPVADVSTESLPAQGDQDGQEIETAEQAPTPPVAADAAADAMEPMSEDPVATPSAEPIASASNPDAAPATTPTTTPADAGEDQTLAVAQPTVADQKRADLSASAEGSSASVTEEETAALPLEPWDAPAGTILVQVSAIQDRGKIAGEWQRLKAGYPSVLGPLRLVVEEAKLGDKGVFFRVQAGGFASQEQAEEACSVLTGQGQACFVVERPAGTQAES